MGHDHEFDLYKEGISQKLDPKSKLLITIVGLIGSSFLISFEQLVIALLLLLVLARVFGSDLRKVLLKSTLVLPLVISLSLLSYFAYPNGGLLHFSEYSIFYPFPYIQLFFFSKTLLLVFQALILSESVPSFYSIIHALSDLHVPEPLITVLLFMQRSILDLREEARRMLDARYARSAGRRFGTSLDTYRVLGYMLGGLLSRTFLRMEQRRIALVSRGFQGSIPHAKKPFTTKGLLVLWLSAIAYIALLLYANLKFLPIGDLR